METPTNDPIDPLEPPRTTAGGFVIPEFLRKFEGIRRRVMSALIMITIVLFAVIAGGIWFASLVVVMAIIMIREWDALVAHETKPGWKLGGLAYVAVPAATLFWLRNIAFEGAPNAGMLLLLYLLFVVCATDIGAFFTGRSIGGPKLAPSISPGKTWAGLVGGMLAAGVAGVICASFTLFPISVMGCFWTGMILAVVAQAGDLFESWLKRRAGVKDSGALLPGHGGLLDRVDGFVFATPIFALMVGFSGLAL